MPAAVTIGGLVINLSANTSQLKSDLADASASVKTSSQTMTNAWAGVAAESDHATAAGERLVKQLKEEIATFGMSKQELTQHKANLNGVGAEVESLIKRLNAMHSAETSFAQDLQTGSVALREHGAAAREAGGHMDGFSLQTAGAKRELLVLVHELSQGNFKRFGGSLLVLGEQTGAAGLLFSAAGLGAIAFGAAVIGIGAAVIKGTENQRAMNNALIETGNYAGLTGASLDALAHSAVASGGSIGEAKKAVTDLASSGKFTGEQIGYISEAAVEMEHATGKSIDKTIAEFESLAVEASGNSLRTSEAISKATIKLDEQYHFLTEDVYEQIRALEKEGNQKAASALATETLAKVTKDRAAEMAQNIGSIQRGWNSVKEVIGEVIDGLGKVGMKNTAASDAAKASAKLADFDQGLKYAGITDPEKQLTGSWADTRKKLVLDLVDAYDKLNKADAAAIAQGKARVAQSEAVLAASRIEQDDMKLGRKSMTELDDSIQKWGQDMAKIAAVNPNSPLLSPEAVNQHMALLLKAHTPTTKGNDDRSKVLQDALTREQTAFDHEKSIYDEREKELDIRHSKLSMSDAEFYAGREAARAAYVAAEGISFAKEAALVKAAEAGARNPEEVAAAKSKYDELVRAHQKFVDDMHNSHTLDGVNSEADIQKSYDEIAKATADAGATAIKSLDDQIAKQQLHNAEIGKTKAQIELEKQAIEDKATAQLQSDADYLRDGLTKWELDDKSRAIFQIRLSNLDSEIDKRKTLSGLLADGSHAEEIAKASADLDKYLDPAKAEKFGSALKGSLGSAAKSMNDLTNILQKLGAQQAAYEEKRAEALVELRGNEAQRTKGLKDLQDVENRNTKEQLAGYGNLAGAAASFFGEHSRGYQALSVVSQAFHAAELAMTLAEQGPKAINAILTQGSGDPYTAFGRMAAMAAIVAGLGVAIGGIGGGGDTTAKDRQAAQGTGTVLGDSSAKSDSISKSIELTASNSSTQITYLAGMEASLKNIESNISSFASELLRTTDVTNPNVSLNKNNGFATMLGSAGLTAGGGALGYAAGAGLTAFTELGAIGGPVGMVAGALVGAIASKIPAIGNLMTSIFGGKQTLNDSGFTVGKSSLGSILSMGANAQQYADVTKSGGWFSSDKHNTQTTSLGADANSQITRVIASLDASIVQAGALLGITGDDFADKLNSFVVDIGKVSLKGLTGDDLQKALESVFSKLGDQMAEFAVGGLEQFQQVGEGYLQTLTRVATDYAKLDASLQSIGATFGATGVASIAARENLISLLGGIDDFQSKTADYAQNFLTKQQQLAPVQAFVNGQLQAMGEGWIKTRTDFAAEIASLSGKLDDPKAQQTYAALMNLEAAFAAVTPAIEDTTKSLQDIADERKDLQGQLDQLTMTQAQLLEKQRDALDSSNQALFDQVQAAQKVKDAQDSAKTSLGNFITQMKSFATTAAGLNNSLVLGALSTLTPEQQLAEARRQFEQTRQQAAAGDTTAQGQLQSVEQTFLQLSDKLNGHDAAFSSDLAEVMQANDQLAKSATNSVDVAQASLDVLNDSSATLTDISAYLSQIANGVLGTAAVAPVQRIAHQAAAVAPMSASAPAPVDYSSPSNADMAALVAEVKAMRAEIAGRRADAVQQTGDLMKAGDKSAQDAAERVGELVHDAITDGAYAVDKSERKIK